MIESNLINIVNKLYNDSEYKDILYPVLNTYIPFDSKSKNIGICLSGGSDSALLTYLICDLIKNNNLKTNIHIITGIRMWKLRPWQEQISLEVYNYFVKQFPMIKFYRHLNFVPPEFEYGSSGPTIFDEYGKLNSGDVIELRAFSEYVVFHNNLDAWYTTANKNPSDISFENRLIERDFDEIDFSRIINKTRGFYMLKPFLYLEKNWLINCYKEYNIMDLFAITRSCEGDNSLYPNIFKGLDYRTYIPGNEVPTCNECFWCKERQWGLTYGQ